MIFMKTIQKISLLAIALTFASCNEKISPELLQSSNVVNPGTSTPVPPEEFYFRVVNTSSPILNYKLHKTGAGNANAKCEIRNTTGLSSDIFRVNPAANDISCYFEAEELSLNADGFRFAIEASRNTCDFIGYSPFGFFEKIPGDSTSSFIQVSCMNDTTGNAEVATAAVEQGLNIQAGGANIGCGEWVTTDPDIPVVTREKFTPTSDEELCRFNYEEDRCDIGTITVNELAVSFTPATPDSDAVLQHEIIPRTISCRGQVANCVKGPVKQMTSEYTRFTEVVVNKLNQETRKEYIYEGLMNQGKNSNMSYANFRRNLANVNINFNTSFGMTPAYKSIWSNASFGKIFQTRLMDYYSSNLMFDNVSKIVSDGALLAEATKSNKWKAVPLAAEPFMGLEDHKINPFYTMYCLDTAYDIKARIRMVVRDWDRVYNSNNEEIEFLSDLFKLANSKQDSPGYVELDNELDTILVFNDKKDWDDQIPMTRTPDVVPGVFDPATIWRPTPTAAYPTGWFNPAMFPTDKKL
jgi:hypothetical protein